MSPSDYALKLQTTLKTSALVPGPAEVLVPQDFTPTTALNVVFDVDQHLSTSNRTESLTKNNTNVV